MPSRDVFEFVFQRSVHRNRRVRTAWAHLRPAMQRRNVDMRPHAHAAWALFEGNRAVGVEYLRRGERRIVHAAREVIVSGGAFGSPQLLPLSCIGPPARLGELGIALRKALLMTSADTDAAVPMIAEKAADMVLDVPPPEPVPP